jgi:hypothetical protein
METAALIFRAYITEKWKTAFSLALLQPECLQLAPICCVAVLPMMIQLHSVLTPLVRMLCGQITVWRKHSRHTVELLAHETVGNGACSPSGHCAPCATWRACVHIQRCRSTGKFSLGQQSLYCNLWYGLLIQHGAAYEFSRTWSWNMCVCTVRSTSAKFSPMQ